MDYFQTDWVWVSAGILLGIIEMLIPTGYILLGFASGAVVTGLLMYAGIHMNTPLTLLVFALLSGASWVLLRLVIKRGSQRPDVNDNHPPSP
jgi:inner membrane protein